MHGDPERKPKHRADDTGCQCDGNPDAVGFCHDDCPAAIIHAHNHPVPDCICDPLCDGYADPNCPAHGHPPTGSIPKAD
jgi:hypothetical protein